MTSTSYKEGIGKMQGLIFRMLVMDYKITLEQYYLLGCDAI
jgi:hypothetical protein